ncbi:hypothetical protein [Nocardia sp. CA-119907]|uniref:hypothetical protein n=1 Tax=Nocardia sp. CA-119907 TaxID=3239973 RepID=UPI003D9568BD
MFIMVGPLAIGIPIGGSIALRLGYAITVLVTVAIAVLLFIMGSGVGAVTPAQDAPLGVPTSSTAPVACQMFCTPREAPRSGDVQLGAATP